MNTKRPSTYQVLVYVAYGFYFLLGLAWLVTSLLNGRGLNLAAVFVTVIFATQIYYRHLLTNLILGVITLLFSVYMLLYSISGAVVDAHAKVATFLDVLMVGMSAASIIFSGILIFSFLKLNFRDQL